MDSSHERTPRHVQWHLPGRPSATDNFRKSLASQLLLSAAFQLGWALDPAGFVLFLGYYLGSQAERESFLLYATVLFRDFHSLKGPSLELQGSPI